MTTAIAKELELTEAQHDLIELIDNLTNDELTINRDELDPRQRMVLLALEKKELVVTSKTGNITLTEKTKEDTKMAAKGKTEVKGKDLGALEVMSEVARDLNEVLGLEPAIPHLEKDANKLLKAIRIEAGQIGVDPKTEKVTAELVKADKKELKDKTWKWLEENGMLAHLEVAEPKKAEKAEKAPAKAETKKAEKAETKVVPAKKVAKKAEEKGPGVIATIVEIVKKATKKEPVTKAEILKQLKKQFPDREEKSMNATISVQLPSRMAKEKELNIQGDAAEGFYIGK